MHVFDQANEYVKDEFGNQISDSTPMRYKNNGTEMDYCFDSIEYTDGNILYSGSAMLGQTSCEPDTSNGGDYYTSLTANVGMISGTSTDSVCPKGWQIATNTPEDKASYDYLFYANYGQDTATDFSYIRLLPFSYLNSGGYYSRSPGNRKTSGSYWTARIGYRLTISSTVSTQNTTYYSNGGFAVRCVSR